MYIRRRFKNKVIYSSYKKVENEGYVVVHDKKYEYISTDGKKLIKYKKGTTLSVVENMIVAKDAKGKYTIYDQQGKELYKDSKKVKIYTWLFMIKNMNTFQQMVKN